MKKIHKLVLKAFLGPFALTFAVVVFIFVTQTLVKYFEEIVGKGLGLMVYAKLLFYFAVNTSTVAFPLAILLSSLITFGNLGEFNEITAMKGAGISLVRVLAPVFWFAVGLTLFAFWFNNNVVPKANLNAYSLLYDIRQKKPSLSIKEGIFYNGLDGVSIKANHKYPDGKSMREVIIYDHRDGYGNSSVILADSAQMYNILSGKYLVFELFNGTKYDDHTATNRPDQKGQFMRNNFKHTKLVFSLASFEMDTTDQSLFKYDRLMKNFTELRQTADSLNRDVAKKRQTTEAGMTQYYYHHLKRVDTAARAVKMTNPRRNWLDSTVRRQDEQPIYQKANLYETAANQARNVKSNLEGSLYQVENAAKEYRVFAVERHRRFTQSVACLVMFLIGAPLGAIIRKGGLGVPVLVSIGFFIIFYVLTLLGEKWAKEGLVQVIYGTWLADFVLFLIGLFFLRQARHDSRLFDADAYKIAFNRFLARFRKKGTRPAAITDPQPAETTV
ncbi:MAG: LptF/LptG family permease [Cytophagales bacterium]|jgi:lipopolysaccharide export system permease protein|nr:LptF/LptG family permease [Cytophagales bacterium]